MKKNLYVVIISFLFSSILWVSITLTEEYFTTYNVPARVVNAPYGYALASELPTNISVKIRGIGWRLTGIGIGSESVFNVSAKNDSGRILANLYANIVENPWLSTDVSVIDIVPDTVSFFIERIVSKKLLVVPDLKMSFKTGFGLASSIKVVPDSVVVFGPKSLMEKLSSFSTQTIKLSALDNQTKLKAVFNNDRFRTNIAAVEVTLDVQRMVDKNIENISVEVLDVPVDRDVILLPNTVTSLVKGGINVLGKLNASDFKAYVYYRDVLLDTVGTVAPVVDLPENVELVSIRPDRLRYVIRKFN